MKKQQVVDICDAENKDLQLQLDKLLQQVSKILILRVCKD